MKVVKCDCCGKELVGRIFKFAFEIEDEEVYELQL